MSTSPIASRTLHLVDLENLVGDPRAEAAVALATFAAYLEVARYEPDDHVIVAANPWMMAKVGWDLAVPASCHAIHGHDGADLMLLSLAPPELVVRRYHRLVIGSGDGIFTSRARAVHERGVEVDVVARADRCARGLHRFHCAFLDPTFVLAA